MTLLIDFKAAFPSVSHQFMMFCFKAMGMPASMIRVLQALYLDGHCCISVGGALWEGFSMTSGIRQGCPLSLFIFAVVMDVLLRRLTSNLTGSHVHKAFADDVGIVLSDLDNQLAALVAILDSFEVISGMQVNVSKTVGIPLWPCELTEASLLIGTGTKVVLTPSTLQRNLPWLSHWTTKRQRRMEGCPSKIPGSYTRLAMVQAWSPLCNNGLQHVRDVSPRLHRTDCKSHGADKKGGGGWPSTRRAWPGQLGNAYRPLELTPVRHAKTFPIA